MQTANETWKWGVVLILLAIFLVTANQAYQHVTTQEYYEPPDDYKMGDSWDLEHSSGPGAGQGLELPPESTAGSDMPPTDLPVVPEGDEDVPLSDEIDWNQLGESSGDK